MRVLLTSILLVLVWMGCESKVTASFEESRSTFCQDNPTDKSCLSSSVVSSSSSQVGVSSFPLISSVISSSSVLFSTTLSSSSVVVSSSVVSSSSSAISYGTLVDARDGKSYKTVVIGTQTWMAENLNYLPAGKEANGAWCYNNSIDSCAKYGRLYDWATAMELPSSCNTTDCSLQIQAKQEGVCPQDWHIPSGLEFDAFINVVGGVSKAGVLKSQSNWNGTNDYGYSVIPSGFKYDYGNYGYIGGEAIFWSSSQTGHFNAYNIRFYDLTTLSIANSSGDAFVKKYAFSIRCIKN